MVAGAATASSDERLEPLDCGHWCLQLSNDTQRLSRRLRFHLLLAFVTAAYWSNDEQRGRRKVVYYTDNNNKSNGYQISMEVGGGTGKDFSLPRLPIKLYCLHSVTLYYKSIVPERCNWAQWYQQSGSLDAYQNIVRYIPAEPSDKTSATSIWPLSWCLRTNAP